MTDVSHIARSRMAKMPVAGPHPDADLLAAFSERSLSGREREQVLAHLSTCTDCREVVALAAPELAEASAAAAPARARWLPWPVFVYAKTWGAVAAAVVIVAIAVKMQSPSSKPADLRQIASAPAPRQDAFVSAAKEGKAQTAQARTDETVRALHDAGRANEARAVKSADANAYASGSRERIEPKVGLARSQPANANQFNA